MHTLVAITFVVGVLLSAWLGGVLAEKYLCRGESSRRR
jgi:hypothetical protein